MKKIVKIVLIIIVILVISATIIIVINKKNTNEEDVLNHYSFEYKNHYYYLPNDLFYKIDNVDGIEMLNIYSNKDKWGALIKVFDKSEFPEDAFDNFDSLYDFLTNYISIANKKVIVRDNISIPVIEMISDKYNALVAYLPAFDNYEYEMTVFDGDDKSMNYNALDEVINVLFTEQKKK